MFRSFWGATTKPVLPLFYTYILTMQSVQININRIYTINDYETYRWVVKKEYCCWSQMFKQISILK
jgi:hypothetical protein